MWVVRQNVSWLRILLFGGRTLPPFFGRVLFATGLAFLTTYLHRVDALHFPDLTPQPFILIGLPLGIFLGFRNSSAYDRYWEARKVWGELTNTARTWARQTLTLPNQLVSHAERAEAARLVAAFAHGLRARLREASPAQGLELLSKESVETWRAWCQQTAEAKPSLPYFVLEHAGRRVSRWREQGALADMTWMPFEQSLTTLSNVLGACERIRNTPIPYSYAVLMHRIVAVYCTLLPLGFSESVGFSTPFLVFAVSYALFGLDAIAEEIEQPFGTDPNDLPLDRICEVIERDIKHMLREPHDPIQTQQEFET